MKKIKNLIVVVAAMAYVALLAGSFIWWVACERLGVVQQAQAALWDLTSRADTVQVDTGNHIEISHGHADTFNIDSANIVNLSVTNLSLSGLIDSSTVINLADSLDSLLRGDLRDSIAIVINDSTTNLVEIPSHYNMNFLDTTLALGGSKLRYFDIRQKRYSEDFDLYRTHESSSSWFTGKYVPSRFLVVISNTASTDTVRIIDADSAKTFATILANADSNYIIDGSTVADVRWMDHCLYIATETGIYIIDWLADNAWLWSNTGRYIWNGDLSDFTAKSGYSAVAVGVGFGTLSNGSFEVWRTPTRGGFLNRPIPDLFGTGSGTADGWVYYRQNSTTGIIGAGYTASSITDSGGICEMDREHGSMWWQGWITDHYRTYGRRSINSLMAASWSHEVDEYNVVYSNKLAASSASAYATRIDWALTTKPTGLAILEAASAAGGRNTAVYITSDSGMYALHNTFWDPQTNAGKVRWNTRYNTPYAAGNWVVMLPLISGSPTEDASAYGNDFTENGVITYTDPPGPYGQGCTFTGGTAGANYYSRADDADFDGALAPLSFGAWVRLDSVGTTAQFAWSKWDLVTTANMMFYLGVGTDESPVVGLRVGAATKTVSGGVALETGKWFYLVGAYDGVYLRGYVNGYRMAAPTAATGVPTGGSGAAHVGLTFSSGSASATSRWKGAVQGAWFSHKNMTDQEVQYEYERGRKLMEMGGSNYNRFPADSLKYCRSDYYNYILAGNGDSAFCITSDIITGRYVNPGTPIVDAAVWAIPGTQGPSYALLTGTQLKLVQADGMLTDVIKGMPAYREWNWGPYAIQVDSAGWAPFWEPVDACYMIIGHTMGTASSNNTRRIQIDRGTYAVGVMEVPDSATIIGSGPTTILTNLSNSADNALCTSTDGTNGAGITIANLAVDSDANDGNTDALLAAYGSGTISNILVRGSGSDGVQYSSGNYWIHDIIVNAAVDADCVDIGGDGAIVENVECKGNLFYISADNNTVRNIKITGKKLFVDSNADSNTIENITMVGSDDSFLDLRGSNNRIQGLRMLGEASADEIIILGRNNTLSDWTGTTAALICTLSSTAENCLITRGRGAIRLCTPGAGLDTIIVTQCYGDSIRGDTTQDATHIRAANWWGLWSRGGP